MKNIQQSFILGKRHFIEVSVGPKIVLGATNHTSGMSLSLEMCTSSLALVCQQNLVLLLSCFEIYCL